MTTIGRVGRVVALGLGASALMFGQPWPAQKSAPNFGTQNVTITGFPHTSSRRSMTTLT